MCHLYHTSKHSVGIQRCASASTASSSISSRTRWRQQRNLYPIWSQCRLAMLTRHIRISSTVTRCASDTLSFPFTDLSLKAMAIVTERLNANKPATPEPKGGKITSAQMNNNKDLEVDLKKEEPSFFG